MDRIRHDARQALRGLVRRPVFFLVAAGSLALGIAAVTSIFSIANALLLRPPSGVTGAERVVELGRTTGGRGFDTFSYPDFLDLREQVASLDHVTAWSMEPVSFSTSGEGERITAMLVSANYFETLGVPPGLGRYFVSSEDVLPGEAPVAVVAHDFWQERLGADPAVIGSTITLNRHAFTVVGVAPPEFRGHLTGVHPQVWVPFMMKRVITPRGDDFEVRGSFNLLLIGRLAEGATLEQARAAVHTVFRRLQDAYPGSHGQRDNEVDARIVTLGPVPGAGRAFVGSFVGALGALVTMVLLITCANVGGMLLARGAAREKEMALRLALGAGRGRLVEQLLAESLALFVVGGGLGLLLSVGLLEAASRVRLETILPLAVDVRPDATVFLFAVFATLFTGLVFGLTPALGSTALDLVPALRDEGAGGPGKGRMRRLFVTGQLGLSLVLLAAAGLFVRSLQRAGSVDTGFRDDGVLLTSFDLSLEGYAGPDEGRAFQDELLARVRRLPGVESAGLALDLPLDLASHGAGVRPEAWTSPEGSRWMGSDFNRVTPGYFETLGIPVMRGRAFTDDDRADGLPVAVVSEAFAAEAWPGQDPVGRTVVWSMDAAPTLTVVGVVSDVKNQTITESPDPMLYVPEAQAYAPAMTLVVRETSAGTTAGALARSVLSQDPGIALTPVTTLETYTAVATLPQRIGAGITTALGFVALLLSGMGVYGVIAFTVSRQTREIGVRMALGAEARQVVRMVMAGAVRVALPGLAVGAVLAVLLGWFLRAFLLGVSPVDPATLTAVSALLAGLVAGASWVPAHRAARVDPVDALRSE